VAVPIDVLQQVLSRYQVVANVMPIVKNPYMWGVKRLVEKTIENQKEWGLSEPVDYIFDSRSEGDDVRAGWRMYEVFPPSGERDLVGRKPMFEDDEKVLPLQAADMWVWWCRKRWLEDGSFTREMDFPIPWGTWEDVPAFMSWWTEEEIKRELYIMSAGIEAAGGSE